MTRLIGISGSLRTGSLNTSLLKAVREVLPDGAELTIASIAAVPLYNFDIEEVSGIPEPVAKLKSAIAQADGLVISTPEYNNSIPGVLKNAMDWLSRPPKDTAKVFGDLPVCVMGATPGAFGTVLAQSAWLPVLRALGVRYWSGGRLLVPGAGRVFDEAGQLTDAGVRDRLTSFISGFIAFVEDSPRRSAR